MSNSSCSMTNNIGYYGYATLEFRNKGELLQKVKIHNSGCDFLLTSLAKALCGLLISDAVPSKIDWCNDTAQSLLHSAVTISGLKYTEAAPGTKGAEVEAYTILKPKDIKSSPSSSTQLKLYGKGGAELATIELSETETDTLYVYMSENRFDCLIRWHLQISNKG